MRIILYIIIVTVFSSCTNLYTSNAFDDAVASYQKDSLKLQAALYLKKHSEYHYGITRRIFNAEEAKRIVKYASNDSVCRHHLDSIGCKIITKNNVWDCDTITKEYICENIDLAFDSWKNPWSRDISFDDFCKYILPYRNGDEELHDWRRYFKEKYESTIADSVSDPTSIKEVALYMISKLRKDIAYGPRMGVYSRKMLTTSNMETLHWMECSGCAHYVTLAMRACGIPCTIITNCWRFTEVPHTTVLFPAVGSNKKAFRLTIGDDYMEMGEAKDTMAVWCCWAKSYEPNQDLLDLLDDYNKSGQKFEALRNFALPVTREDVSSQFSTTYNLSLPIPDSLKSHRHLFLCRFYQWKWFPTRVGKVDKDSVCFRNAPIRQLYRLGVASGDSVKTFGNIFTLVGDSGKVIPSMRDIIRPYNQDGDTVTYKFAYGCDSTETRLTRDIRHWYWSSTNKWKSFTEKAVLWGYDVKTDSYKVFNENMRGIYKPVFHLVETKYPKWTIFIGDEIPRPLGFLHEDTITNEGYVMEF